MSILDRLLPDFPEDQQAERNRLLGLMLMFFLVVTAVGVLKPVRNALALTGLGEQQFYRVYLISAVVVLFVPIYNRLADRFGWRTLVPALAIFFGLNLVAFRLAYTEGSAVLGVVFYGWYDLFAAALVTQFFVATQIFLTARSAKSAYPLVIGGGAVGAMLGGLIAWLLATPLGTANLLLVGALFILAFGLGIGFVWPDQELEELDRERRRRAPMRDGRRVGELQQVFSNAHVRLIAATVLLAVFTKQLVDYQFNTLTEQIFVTQDAITAFQGKVNLVTQGLPLLSVLALRPLLRRWGVGAVAFILPVLLLVSGLGMVAVFTVWTVIIARTADTTFRYSAERAGREILYVPVPEAIKLKAKTYIDVGIEKGLGKALAAGLLALLVEVLELSLHQIAWVVVALAAGWVVLTAAVRREYVRTLARSIRGRFASFEGLAILSDAHTQKVVRGALQSSDPVQASFALDLVDQSAGTDTTPIADALHDLLEHESQDIRRKALAILTRDPSSVRPDRVRPRLLDPARTVREHAVRALVAAAGDAGPALLADLLRSEHAEVRMATLSCLARGDFRTAGGEPGGAAAYGVVRVGRAQRGARDARIELALAAGAMRDDPRARDLLEPFLGDPDPLVASAAIRSAGMLAQAELRPAIIAGLRAPATRQAAREALAEQGAPAVDLLAEYLLDESAHPAIRRHIPSVLAHMPEQKAVSVMLHSVIAPETDQLLDYRTLKALSQLRARYPALAFEPEMVHRSIRREVGAAQRYDRARRCLRRISASGSATGLLIRALDEARAERLEGVFLLLGLLHTAPEIHRCFMALIGGERIARANALEWLEETVDHTLFAEMAPVLGEMRPEPERPAPETALRPLLDDGDPWIARLAIAATAELAEPWSREALRDIIDTGPGDEHRALAERLLDPNPSARRAPMDLIEKVFLLQRIDLLRDARSAHLALLASIAEEVDVAPGTVLIRQEEPTDALYVVVDGVVELEGVADQKIDAAEGQAFGTWALIDDAPSLVTARAMVPSRLMRITRNDFHDLLADHSELALGLLQGLARRVRTLVA